MSVPDNEPCGIPARRPLFGDPSSSSAVKMAALNVCCRGNRLGNLISVFENSMRLNTSVSCFHTTSVFARGKRKVKVVTVPRLIKMKEDGASEEEIQDFVEKRAAKRKATAEHKAKMEVVAVFFREQLRLEEEKKKDVEGEQMKREAEERELEARNIAMVLKNNEELKRERELRNLINAEKRQKEEEARALEEMEQEKILFEKRRALVLQAIEESKDFVTKENLDEKITHALENEVNYNFAITPDGKKLYSTKPPGNFFEHNWQGPSPAAFQMGGYRFGEWDFLFEKKYASTLEKKNEAESNKENEAGADGKETSCTESN